MFKSLFRIGIARPWPWLTLLIWFGVLVSHRSAHAGASEPRVVAVFVAGSDADVTHLSSVLQVSLNAAHIRARIRHIERIAPHRVSRPTSAEAPSAARLWLDCSEPARARLYLTTPDASRIFVRDFSLEHGLDATALELLVFVSRNSVLALLAGDDMGIAREEYERTFADPHGEADETTALVEPAQPDLTDSNAAHVSPAGQWHLAARYELLALTASHVEHGPGAVLEWELNEVSFGLSAQARFPVQVGDGPIHARLVSRSARLFIARPLRLSAAASFSLAAGLGFDWIRVEPETSDGAAAVNSSFSVVDAVARASAGFRYRVRALELGAHAGVELGLVPARYRVQAPSGAAQDVFSPWRVRPFGALTLGTHW